MIDGIPIYRGDGHVIGHVEGDTFYKTISRNHYLKRPPAIAFDVGSLEQANEAGAIDVRVIDRDSTAIYKATIQQIFGRGQYFNRGCGHQIFMVMDDWEQITSGEKAQLDLWNST